MITTGFGNVENDNSTTTDPCVLSVGGVVGELWNLRGKLYASCPMCKVVV